MNPADLLIVNGHCSTLDPAAPSAEVLAVSDGRIVAVGDTRVIGEWRGPRTEVLDVRGGTILPGLVDGHTHPVLGLEMATGLDLAGCHDLEAVRAALARAADASPRGEWVRAWGLNPNSFGNSPIAASAIEVALGGLPAYIVLFDGHSALVSAEALRLAGVTGRRRFSSNSEVVCDEGGSPTGLLLEEGAMELVRSAIPPESVASRASRLGTILMQMAATGLTGGHVMDGDVDSLDLLATLEEANRLPLRLRLAPWCRPEDGETRREELVALQTRGGRLWKVAAVKLFMDGTIDGGTAWLDEPDTHGESRTSYWSDPEEFTRALHYFAHLGVQTATHAIGDAAVAHVLASLESLEDRKGVMHRVEHLETLPDHLIPKFGALGVAASMQPTHGTDFSFADHSDNWSRRLGDDRANRAWRCRDLLDAGATLILGSDWPIAPFDPRLTLAAAQLRRSARRPDLAPLVPAQGITALDAVRGYTTSPAAAAGEQDRSGHLSLGFHADLTIFSDDPVAVPAVDLADLPVLATVVDGVVRFRGDVS